VPPPATRSATTNYAACSTPQRKRAVVRHQLLRPWELPSFSSRQPAVLPAGTPGQRRARPASLVDRSWQRSRSIATAAMGGEIGQQLIESLDHTEQWSEGARIAVNLGAALVLFLVAVAGGAAPKWLVSRVQGGDAEGRSLAFSLGNMLSAGVMVSAGFVHLLGDAIEDMGRTDFPVAPLLCATGLLMTIVADAFASSLAQEDTDTQAKPHAGTCCESGYKAMDTVLGSASAGSPRPAGQRTQSKPTVSFVTAALLGCALAFHSVLEGAALGAQETVERTTDVFIAIAAHKGLAAYALGSSLVESKASTSKTWSVLMFFSFATPVGIVAGLLLSEVSTGTASAACSALASGTFLYVALMEVIPNELQHKEHMSMKISTMILGFSLMSVLAKWA